jgi:hypothetical protein
LTTALDIEADAWTTALAEALGVSRDKVLEVFVDRGGKTDKSLRSRSLAAAAAAANGVTVTYEVAVADEADMTTVKKSMGDFAAGGAASLTKLAAALEKVSPGAKTLMASATMVAKTEAVACASDTKTCPDGTEVGRFNSNSCALQPCPASGSGSGSGSSDLSTGEIAGAAIGGLVGAAFVIAVVVFAMGGGGKGAGKPDYGDSSKSTAPEYGQEPVSYGKTETVLTKA